MNWHHHPETADRLAAAYVLGTLRGPARRRFEALLPRSQLLRLATTDWTQRLSPLLTALPPLQPSRALWTGVARRTVQQQGSQSVPWWSRIFGAVPAGALALGLVMGALGPALWNAQLSAGGPQQTQLPASYVGVLGTADGKPGLILSSLRQGRVADIKQVTPVSVPPGMQPILWRLDASGVATPLGPLPQGKWVEMALPEPAEKIFSQAVELAVSLERADGAIPATPTQRFVYRGLCGKLWK